MQIIQADVGSKLLEAWNQYVDEHPLGTIYHLQDWKPLIEQEFGHKVYLLIALDEAHRVVGGVPLVNLKSVLFGNYMVSVPYFNYGGILADTSEVEDSLLAKATELGKSLGVSYIQLREQKECPDYRLPVSHDKVNMILTLPDTAEALGKSIGSKRRSQCRRAEKENVRFLTGGIELLDDFYYVFCRNMRDLGTPVYGKYFFKAICEQFGDKVSIAVAYLDDEPVGTGFLIRYKDRMEIPWASTLRKTNRVSMNMYLYWQILKFAIETGCKEFDFGRSSIDAGTYKFKKQWGAQPHQLHWYKWVENGKTATDLSPSNSKFDMAIRVWQKLPLWLTNFIGPFLVKNLP